MGYAPLREGTVTVMALDERVTLTLTRSNLTIVRKALQRYRMRIEEVGGMGWYDNPNVTRQEIERVDDILAELEAASNGPSNSTR